MTTTTLQDRMVLLSLILLSRMTSSFVIHPTPSLSLQKSKLTSSCWHSQKKRRQTTILRMAVTPIGPFCPFRSSASVKLEPSMANINTAGPSFATDMARLQFDMQMGNTPDPEKMKSVAENMENAVSEWQDLLSTLSSSTDFQTREYFALTKVHLSDSDQTSEQIAAAMKWQASCLRSLGEGRPPPPPPPGVDIAAMAERAAKAGEGKGGTPSIAAMANAERITGTPFRGTEKIFKEGAVREEYEALCRDHTALIDMGASYGSFDPIGKLAFLDQVEKVEERWDIFYTRFSLMGELDQDFVEQCDLFLESMGLDQQDFRGLLKRAHDDMRNEAEKERIA